MRSPDLAVKQALSGTYCQCLVVLHSVCGVQTHTMRLVPNHYSGSERQSFPHSSNAGLWWNSCGKSCETNRGGRYTPLYPGDHMPLVMLYAMNMENPAQTDASKSRGCAAGLGGCESDCKLVGLTTQVSSGPPASSTSFNSVTNTSSLSCRSTLRFREFRVESCISNGS